MDEPVEILLIEDDPAHAELIQRAFDFQGDLTRLICVGTLAEARAHLKSSTPKLIIADWRLPDGDSLELLTPGPSIAPPIIIMTSYGNENIAVETMKAGALDYIVKSQEVFMDMPHIAQQAIRQREIVSEREQMQTALRDSEAQFRLLAENSTDLIARLHPSGSFLYVSPASRALFNFEPEELVNREPLDFIHPEDKEEFLRVYSRLIEPPSTNLTCTFRFRHKDGQYIWMESNAHTLFDDSGEKPLEIHISSRDITQRKRFEEELRYTHHSLEQAYEATLMGWSHALELRDRETQGHSQRVMNLTIQLARAVGVPEDHINHIRWGVLLHDIGKLGVSDEILRKPGPLTEAEWVEMRRHPTYAFDMLYPISYLHSALDIPYCHHEKWDGTGYPSGLKGEEIPLSARIFAIVDVWDAMSNDRPYRKRLPRQEVRAYIKEQAGRHFDSVLVNKFLSLPEIKDLSLGR